MNFDDFDQDLLLARGKYATTRAAHEDQLKRLQILTGQLSSAGSQILRLMQPEDGEPCDISGLLKDARATIDQIQQCADQINELATQKAELKPKAWPK
jgi:hypothetical protein